MELGVREGEQKRAARQELCCEGMLNIEVLREELVGTVLGPQGAQHPRRSKTAVQ